MFRKLITTAALTAATALALTAAPAHAVTGDITYTGPANSSAQVGSVWTFTARHFDGTPAQVADNPVVCAATPTGVPGQWRLEFTGRGPCQLSFYVPAHNGLDAATGSRFVTVR